MRRDRHARRGQALVESAFVLLVFLAFCIGTLDFGQYLYFHQALSERVRAAARYGALNWTDRTGIQNVALYNDPAGTVNGATAIIPNLTAAMVAVCLPGDTGCSNPASTTESRITVTITGYNMTTFNFVFPRSFTNRPIVANIPSEKPIS
jgi:Flp pilus assembly protein TadG